MLLSTTPWEIWLLQWDGRWELGMSHALWLQHRSSVDHELQKGVGKAVITHVGVRRGIPSGEVLQGL